MAPFAGRLLALAVALFAAAPPCFAQADYAREKRWAEEITPAILVGDPVYLKLASGRQFLAIFAPHPKARAGVVLVHGMGVHPDWGLLNPLRSDLVDAGYATLSVQMPVLAADAAAEQYRAVFPEAAERIAAAVSFLRGKGYAKVAIVSHSLGSRMTNYFLEHDAGTPIDAWVAIGLGGRIEPLGKFKGPILDLFGEADRPPVLQNAEKRAALLHTRRGSGQIEVPGADHFFTGKETELVKKVALFLDRQFK